MKKEKEKRVCESKEIQQIPSHRNLLFGVLIQIEDVKPAITKEKQGLKEKRKKKTPWWRNKEEAREYV